MVLRAMFNHLYEALAATGINHRIAIASAYFLILIHLCVALHEAGHWTSARLLSMPVLGFRVGPFGLDRISPSVPWSLRFTHK
jgi:hypothetical protein